MRLKELTLTGYKTFADRIKFEFPEGITAIIGPNGSGKSNVADAIRWALGEQSYSLLRGKRTDDMIFSGSSKRARASMAEVVMTFDNADGFFPVEFSEVSIGRRAYRDGQNEYLLNGHRVRLRDVADLLGNSGLAERTYTVIGQGLVDTALQLKPEERRALFEEAAGIGMYRDRRDDALRKMDETRHNLERAKDILSEITPRLRTLERQAERATAYQGLAIELDAHTRAWFAHHYGKLTRAIAESTRLRDAALAHARAATSQADQLEAEVAGLRQQQAALRAELATVQPQLDEARRRNEVAAREVAVLRERHANLAGQIAALQREVEERTLALAALDQRALAANDALVAAQAQLKERQAGLDEAQKVAAEFRAQRAALERERSDAQLEVMRFSAQLSGTQNRLNVLRARQTSLMRTMAELNERSGRVAAQRGSEAARLATLEAAIVQDAARAQDLAAAIDTVQRELEAARGRSGEAHSAFAASEAEFKMAERMNTFVQLRAQSREGDLAPAAHAAGLPGYRGTLAGMIQIHPDDERSVRAALGDALTAVLIDSDEGATRARAWLARQPNDRGRLMLITLPTLRAVDDEYDLAERAAQEIARAHHARPVLDAVVAPEWLRPALRLVLGRAFICRDLDAARALALALPAGCACVTRDGEIAFPTGALHLAAGARRAVVIGESEEPEGELLLSIEQAQTRLASARTRRDEALAQLNAARARADEAARARNQHERESTARRAERDAITQRRARYEDQLAQTAGELARAEGEQGELQAQVAGLEAALGGEEGAQGEAQQRLTTIEFALREQAEANLRPQMDLFASEAATTLPLIEGADSGEPRRGWMEALNHATAAVATAQGDVRSSAQRLTERQVEQNNMRHALATRQQQLAALAAQHAEGAAALARAESEASEAAAAMQAIEAQVAPIQSQADALDQRVFDADTRRREAEHALREAESRLSAAELDLARQQDEMSSLHERARDALTAGLDAAAAPVGPPEDGAPGAVSILETLAPVDVLEEGVDERIAQLRAQIKRLGAINFEAQAEFVELSQRHKFISEQGGDLEQAVAALQQVIAELNDVMRVTFRQTFDAIAREFQDTFKMLFGGGQAKLVLVNGDDIDLAGVEIQAQPPGKRPQSLALLSGGERSLTAGALLFAILKVKPTPFCVLDEMDAALDEANVFRFRSMIESLLDRTQFVVITHNRRTVEAARTIYGISMGPDSASLALSLRLEEAEARLKKD